LDDPTVASIHCSLVRTPVGVWVVDLLGEDGIGVNDAVLRFAPLADADVLRIGRYRIRVRIRPCRFEQAASMSGRGAGSKDLMPQSQSVGRFRPDHPKEGPTVPSNPALASTAGSVMRFPAPGQVAGVDWVSAGNEPVLLERGTLSESLLVSVVNQFGLMQQQMLDQFQQAISILVQTFGSLHREQMETIREELDQIRILTREFQALKQELAERTGPNSDLVGRETRTAPSDEHAASTMMIEVGNEQPVGDVERRPASLLGHAAGSLSSPLPTTVNPLPPTVAASQASAEANGPKESGKGQTGRRQGTGEFKPESDREMVVWLHQRMVHLQHERETRWQKILKLLPGLS
jgi:hypothetical protein